MENSERDGNTRPPDLPPEKPEEPLQIAVKRREVKSNGEKEKEPEIKLPTTTGSSKKQESSRKTSISVLLTMPKPLTVWITINCGKF